MGARRWLGLGRIVQTEPGYQAELRFLQFLGTVFSPGGVKEDEAEQKMLQIEDAEQLEQDSLSDDSLSDDDLEGVPLAGNWCE